MNYLRALIISIVFHGLAFASSYVLLKHFFTSQKISTHENVYACPVSLVTDFHDLRKPTYKKAEASINGKQVKKPTIKKVSVSLKDASSSSSFNSAREGIKVMEESGADGGANVIPHPENQSPTYPEEARQKGLAGNLVVELTVNSKGYVDNVEIVSGNETAEILQEVALETTRKWRFLYKAPTNQTVKIRVPIVFDLEN